MVDGTMARKLRQFALDFYGWARRYGGVDDVGILDAGAVAVALEAPSSLEVSVVPFFPWRRESRSRIPERHRCDAGAPGSSEDSQITKRFIRLWVFFSSSCTNPLAVRHSTGFPLFALFTHRKPGLAVCLCDTTH